MPDDHDQHGHGHSCNDPSHHHHHHFDPDELFGSPLPDKPKRKVKKPAATNANQIRSETIPGHRGHENVDDLVNFINGPATATGKSNSNKTKKK